jgi:imidazolonepropionase-like amidohydrolase
VSLHRELELLNRAGLQPIQVLSAATMRTANLFGLTDRGRIAAGLKADMVLVRGDPTSDITATRDILRVWRSGIEVDRRLDRE